VSNRPPNRYELLTCALTGHVLVGLGAALVSQRDALVVRESGGQRWHRCLRCDAWILQRLPESPTSPTVPERAEIELPLRGPALRDRYVLRLIALDRAIHVVILLGIAIAIFFFLDHRVALQHDYDRIMNDFTGGSGGANTETGYLGKVHHILFIQPSHLYELGLVALAYAALESVEMVGLWFAKRWAEYLTFVAVFVFVPLEIYEFTKGFSYLKTLTFIINIAIVLYLLIAKRLFGVRGGHRALIQRREREGGWQAIEHNTVLLAPSP
jgi:uncharacterized membrane protein (DUF2068 family)